MKVYKIKVNGKTYKVELEAVNEVASNSKTEVKVVDKKVDAPKTITTGEGNNVISPIQGTVVNVKVKVGDKVKVGQTVVIVEAMKLENEVVSTFEGEVVEVLVSKGQNVSAKAPLIVIK